MFDHIGFYVGDFQRSFDFYSTALAPLNISVCLRGEDWAMFGKNGKGALWIGAMGPKASPIHIAFAAETRAQVQAFHAAALRAGGSDNGPPGLRPQYHPNYYGAFVLDPDGHNMEAVCHQAEF